jgi:phospholipid/cholesterol/gamma-HCH transport system ATP-binding protein
LDPITTREIDQLLVERKRLGTTLVVVTHNIPSARVLGDELAVLDKGRIVAHGTAQELDASADPLVRAFMRSDGGG